MSSEYKRRPRAPTIDREAENSFRKQMTSVVSSAALTLSLSLGVQLGLFRTMLELKAPSSPAYIAKMAGVNERFLREWLFHMVVGEILELDETGTKYSLPRHHGRVLTSEGLADLTTFIPSMGKIYGDLLHSFKTGNTTGAIFRLPESDFFLRWEQRKVQACERLILALMKHVPDLQAGLEKGINVLDVGCGRGQFLFEMASKFPQSLFTGVDINENLIADARDRARLNLIRDMSSTNIGFAAYDVAILPQEWSGSFDVVIMHEVVYDLPSPYDALQEVKQTLKPGGRLLLVDRCVLADPRENIKNEALRVSALITPIISMNYSLPVAMSQPEGDSEALSACSGQEKLVELIEDVGFTDVQTYQFAFDEQRAETLIIGKHEN